MSIIDNRATMQSKSTVLRLNTEWYTKELRIIESEVKNAKSQLTTDAKIHRPIPQCQQQASCQYQNNTLRYSI